MYIEVVIVNWNTGRLLQECVESIICYGVGSVSKIIVVDNDSSDNSEAFIENLPEVNLIKSSKNLGFSKACNLGASHCESEFILFLNPDTRIYPDTFRNVLGFMQDKKNAEVGLCGVQLFNEQGKIARSSSRFPSLSGILSHSIGLNRIFPALGDPMYEWDHGSTKTVDQIIGAFFFVRHNIFKELKGFDERFFLYFEEVDFSFRAKQIGWSSVYLASAQAFHVGGGSSYQVKSNRLFYSIRSRIQYVCKHFNIFKIVVILFSTLTIEPISRTIFCIKNKSLISIKETFNAYIMLFKWLVFMILKTVK